MLKTFSYCGRLVVELFEDSICGYTGTEMGYELSSFFVICFCSLFLLFVGLAIDRAQKTKGQY